INHPHRTHTHTDTHPHTLMMEVMISTLPLSQFYLHHLSSQTHTNQHNYFLMHTTRGLYRCVCASEHVCVCVSEHVCVCVCERACVCVCSTCKSGFVCGDPVPRCQQHPAWPCLRHTRMDRVSSLSALC